MLRQLAPLEWPATERTGFRLEHGRSSFRRLETQYIEPLVRIDRQPADGGGLLGPQRQAQEDRLPPGLRPSGRQHPVRRLPFWIGSLRTPVEGQRESLLTDLWRPDADPCL